MAYKINFEAYSSNFAVPQEIVDVDFCDMDAIKLKVILLILKNSSKNYSANLISNLLNVSENRVNEAIEYWINRGILSKSETEKVSQAALILPRRTIATQPPKSENSELSYLLECMEAMLKRPITSVEYKTIVHIMEYIKLPADVIIMAIEYCVSIDKGNARYIEKVCTTWADGGVVTHEKAEQYLNILQQSHKNETKIKSIFGISDRALIETEREHIARWFSEYNADFDMIKLAYEKTIKSINKLSFPYINKILLSWHEKGYKSISDVLGETQNKTAKGNISNNPSYDIDEIDKFWDTVPKLT